jgi:alkylated DNA repair protein (DNA oxidative demethylase)
MVTRYDERKRRAMFEVIFQLTLAEQKQLLDICHTLTQTAPLFQKTLPSGAKFNYLCTSAGSYGWMSDRQGYRYVTTHPLTQQDFPPMPAMIVDIAHRAAAHYGLALRPETALINWYGADGSLGLHQDKTEVSRAPVVSISLGDDAIFIRGGLKKTDPKEKLVLKSGDVLVMGGEHRLAYHGVRKIVPHTAPPELARREAGRINITVRQVYELTGIK